MSHQFEVTIAQRITLKSAGLAVLCGAFGPLRYFAEVVRSNEQEAQAECPICQSVHGPENCSTDLLL
jgi:hypothetical protein